MHDLKNPSLPAPRFISGLNDIASRYDVLLCDVWGVVHNGLAAYPEAIDALLQFRSKGGKVILLSNAPVPNGSVRHRLDRLRMPRKSYDAIVTSGDITVSFIIERGGAPLFNIGPSYDRSLYREVRKLSGQSPRLTKLKDAAYTVCTGLFDPDAETPADYDQTLAAMRARNLDFLCANPDLVVHVGPKLMYCAGAVAERYEEMGGKVIQGGKPHAPIYQRALQIAETLLGQAVQRSRILAIGDALRTDIKGAVEQSLDSLFIASGIHQDQLLNPDIAGQVDEKAFTELAEKAGISPYAVSLRLIW